MRRPLSMLAPYLFLAPCLFSALAVASPSPAADAQDDRVRLRDGTLVLGVLVERGGATLELVVPGGSKVLLRGDIADVEFSADREAQGRVEKDAVVRDDGHRIVGKVEVLAGGQQVRVTQESGSRVTLPRRRVVKILRKGDALRTGERIHTVETAKAVRENLDRLRQGGAGAAKAESFLTTSGIFAIQQIRAELARPAEPTAEAKAARAAFERIERLYRLKEIVSPEIERYESDVFKILSSGTVKEQRDLLLFIYYRFVEDSVPIAKFLVFDTKTNQEIRGYGIDFLRRMQKNRELLDVFHRSVGRVQLAAAIALGKNKIYVGVPTLIEALELKESGVRTLAVTFLREFSGLSFRFRPDGAPEARRQAVNRWREWWRKNAENYEQIAKKILAGEGGERPRFNRGVGALATGWRRDRESRIQVRRESAERRIESRCSFLSRSDVAHRPQSVPSRSAEERAGDVRRNRESGATRPPN